MKILQRITRQNKIFCNKQHATNVRKRLRIIPILALMLCAVLPAKARDYVITWTDGGTTYYVGMNGNNIAVKTEFDLTCIWSCRNGNNDANLGNTSYSLRNKNNTTYYLTTSCTRQYNWGWQYTWSALTVQNSASNIWRSSSNTNGNVYARETSYNRQASIRVVNGAWAMYDNNTDGSQNSQVTTTTPGAGSSSTPEIGAIAITPITAELYQGENETFTASATVTVTTYSIPAHTKYTFTIGSTDYEYLYYNGTQYTNTEAFSTKTTTTQTPSYAWTKTGDDGSNATLSSTNAASTTVSHATQVAAEKSITLTVTASYTGAESKTANATVILYGPMVAPTITRSGNSISLATTSANATIYYTTNGSTPTASSTPYTGAFDLTTSPTTVKAIAIRDGHESAVTTETFNIKLPTPVITISNTGLATIALGEGSPVGTTIHYTIDGTVPTGSSTTYSSAVQLTNPQIIKAIAVLTNYDNSDVASGDFITEGVTGTKVILDDREDHSWSYYSDPDCPIRSLSPADVKITYYGDGIMMKNGNNYTANTSSNDYITSSSSDYVGGAKVNVGGENQNTFIYFKTLERGANTQTAWTYSTTHTDAASRCPYTTIPNPFQVRPTYTGTSTTNTADWTGWRGFQCWRLKSFTGGSVYASSSSTTALSAGAVINAETEIYFAPNSEYGMDVQLEAVWAIAYVVKASGANANSIGDHSNVGCERNFIVLNTYSANSNTFYNFGDGGNGNPKRITNIDRQVTVTRYLPNGVRGQNNDATYVRGAGGTNMTLQANTKFENVAFYDMSSYTINAAGNDLIIGRGCSGTVNNIRGGGSDGMDYMLRIESGTYTNYHALNNHSGNAVTFSGTNKIRSVLGSDYDRALGPDNGGNDNLTITGNMYMGQGCRFSDASNGTDGYFKCWVKSGNLLNGSITNGDGGNESFYIGTSGNQNASKYIMPRYLHVEGGQLAGVAGGLDDQYYTDASDFRVYIRMTGGLIRGCLYGAGSYARGAGERRYVLTGGEIGGWVAAGCNGIGSNTTNDNNGAMDGDSYIYIGGDVAIGYKNTTVNSVEGGNVFGAGRGASGQTYPVGTVNNSTIAIADECKIEKNVYGGGNYGYTLHDAKIHILGGTVDGRVFGGANMTQGEESIIYMKDGLVKDGVYGGCNTQGTMSEDVTMHINGGQVGTSSVNANVHGGGYGSSTAVDGNVELTLGVQGQVTPGVTVYGDVYGGSADGSVNNATSDHTYVTLNAGTINGSLYGGGLGITNANCNVNGAVQVVVNGGKVNDPDGANGNPGSIFGCNNAMGSPKSTVTVTVNGSDPTTVDGVGAKTYAINGVYGGGNQAAYNPTTATNGYPKVIVNGCETSIKDVYGGGNAAPVPQTDVTINGGDIDRVFAGGNGESGTPANVGYNNKNEPTTANSYGNGTATALIHGGTINQVFGGSNAHGVIRGKMTVHVESDGTCPMQIGEVYGGGNMADSQVGSVEVVCTGGGLIDYVYGGANQANVTGDIELDITGGRIEHVFGGNNTSGTVSGTITVNVDWDESSCTSNYLGYVYGAGNQATYTHPTGKPDYPEVNIKNGTVTYDVFGAGYGNLSDPTKGVVTGNPQVNVGGLDSNTKRATVGRNVFGGGSSAAVTGNPQVFFKKRAKVLGNVYGGGNQGAVTGNTKVIVNGEATID